MLGGLIYQIADDTRLGRRAFDIRMAQMLEKLDDIERQLSAQNRPGL
jgi:hypothetical protein